MGKVTRKKEVRMPRKKKEKGVKYLVEQMNSR